MMESVPEWTVHVMSITSGAFMGVLVTEFMFDVSDFDKVLMWPLILGIVGAFITAAIICEPKLFRNKIRFDQLYLLGLAGILSFLAGLKFRKEDVAGFYLGGLSHGIAVISGLSILTNRLSASRRNFGFSIHAMLMFLGAAYSSKLICDGFGEKTPAAIKDAYEKIGLIMITCSIVSVVLIVSIEFCQICHFTNYKKSLDILYQKEIDNKMILFNGRDVIRKLCAGTQYNAGSMNYQVIASSLLVSLKIIGYLIFSHLVIFLALDFNTYYKSVDFDVHVFLWLVLAGACLSMMWCLLMNTRSIALISHSVLVGLLLILLGSAINNNREVAAFITWIFYVFLGICYHITYASIVEVAPVRFSEIMIAFAYATEILPISLIQYYSIKMPQFVESVELNTTTIIHTIIHTILMTGTVAIIFFLYPNTFQKSLIQIRDQIHLLKIRRVEDVEERAVNGISTIENHPRGQINKSFDATEMRPRLTV